MVTLCTRDWIRERVSCKQPYSDSVLASGLPDTPAGPLALSGVWQHAKRPVPGLMQLLGPTWSRSMGLVCGARDTKPTASQAPGGREVAFHSGKCGHLGQEH